MENVAYTIGALYYGMLCQLLFMARRLWLNLEETTYLESLCNNCSQKKLVLLSVYSWYMCVCVCVCV